MTDKFYDGSAAAQFNAPDSHRSPEIKRPVQGWEVEVRINGTTALTIGHNHLSGMVNIDEFSDVVENCAHHLLAFIGRPLGLAGVAQPSLPRKLTAENGAKAALIGEFHETYYVMCEDGEEHPVNVPVTWDTIKRIWDAAVAHFDRTAQVSSPHRGTP